MYLQLATGSTPNRYPRQLEEIKPLIADGGAFATLLTIEVDRDDRARRGLPLPASSI